MDATELAKNGGIPHVKSGEGGTGDHSTENNVPLSHAGPPDIPTEGLAGSEIVDGVPMGQQLTKQRRALDRQYLLWPEARNALRSATRKTFGRA